MVPSLANTLIKGKKATDILEHKWIDTFFHPKVGKVSSLFIYFHILIP